MTEGPFRPAYNDDMKAGMGSPDGPILPSEGDPGVDVMEGAESARTGQDAAGHATVAGSGFPADFDHIYLRDDTSDNPQSV